MYLLLCALSWAEPEVPPPLHLQQWNQPLQGREMGTRVGMMVEVADDRPVRIEVWNGQEWRSARETFRIARSLVMVVDLGRSVTEVKFRSPDQARLVAVDWDLFVPMSEPRGVAPPSPGVLPAELSAIGVVSRASWGARSTTCTSTEDNWYRMAIHHTAGTQTYGGSVKGAVQFLQAYAMDSGEYCDIPYQFLVGYDGSLWEGRPYDYYSGATGGGNNDGNIAVSFLGCYHPSGCATSNAVTEEMMTQGQLLVQTLVDMHGIPSDSDAIRGHRDWPGNATACPGDWLYARLDELRTPLGPAYGAAFQGQSFVAPLQIEQGQSVSGTIDLLNIGRMSWEPGVTFLGTTPRDVGSNLAGASWPSSARAATVAQSVAPGTVGSFALTVYGNEVGDFDQGFGLVQEGVIWFADDGGPADGSIHLNGTVFAPEIPDESTPIVGDDSATNAQDSEAEALAWSAGTPVSMADLGCGCQQGTRMGWLWGLGAGLWLRKRRAN